MCIEIKMVPARQVDNYSVFRHRFNLRCKIGWSANN